VVTEPVLGLFDFMKAGGLVLRDVEVHRKDGTTYQSKRWVRSTADRPATDRDPKTVLAEKPTPVPSFKGSASLNLSSVDLPKYDDLNYGVIGSYDEFGANAKKAVEAVTPVIKDKFRTLAKEIARKLKGPEATNDPDALKFFDVNPKMNWAAGEYNRSIGLIQITPSVAIDVYKAVTEKKVRDWTMDGVRVVVHESMHHASNIFQYEGTLIGEEGERNAAYRPNAALEEATTELLAQHCVRDVSENLLGLPVTGTTEPIFERVEDPFGNYEWAVPSGQPVSYKQYVERFANLIAYADGLDDDKTISNQEFQDHIAARALEIKQKAQLPADDQRWGAIANRVLDKFDLSAQFAHWAEQIGTTTSWLSDGSPLPEQVRRREADRVEREQRWTENIRSAVQDAVKKYLTKGVPFSREQVGTHVGVFDEYVRTIVENRGFVSDDWQPKTKQKFIGKQKFDAEGRVIKQKRGAKVTEPEVAPGFATPQEQAAYEADWAGRR